MKKTLSILLCLTMLLNIMGIASLSGISAENSPLFSDAFGYSSFSAMSSAGIWGVENVKKTDATAPDLSGGVVKMNDKDSIRFNWTKVTGAGDFNVLNTYTFEFDAKITDKGDGSTWSSNSATRALYVAFGGWYNLVELNTADGTIKLCSSNSNAIAFSDSNHLNKKLHVKLVWKGSEITATLSDSNGNVLLSGTRSSNNFTDMEAEEAAMTYLVLRCEDGAVEIDNFSFDVDNVAANTTTTNLNIQGNQQAIYQCEMDFNGTGNVDIKLGGTSLAYISADEMKVAGKVVGKTTAVTFGVGTYKLKAMINPAQTMVSTWLTGPNGEVVQRGFYTLANERVIYASATEGNGIKNIKTTYEAVSLNSYTVQTQEPAYTGYNAKVYNIVTSFDDAQTTRNFAWTARHDYINGGAMAVKYRVKGSSAWTVVDAVMENKSTVNGTLSETAQSYYVEEDYYKCDIVGLTANTTYEYKIGKKGSTDETNHWSQIYTFTTAAEEIDEFTFVAVGDTQGLTWNGTTTSDKGFMYAKSALDEAFEEVDDVAFLLHTGDVVERGWRQDYWNYYFKALGDYGASTPAFHAIGNHDTQCNPDHYFYFDYHFNHPNNGGAAALDESITDKITNQYVLNTVNNPDELIYTFDYGNAHFIVLNTGSYNYADDQYLIEAQRQWLINDLEANKDAEWTIMMFHEPVYHRQGGVESRPWLNTVIEGYGVDLVIQGHSHLVTRTYPMKNGQIVTKTNPDDIYKGAGTVYTTIGSTALNHDGVTSANDASTMEEIYNMTTPTAEQSAYTYITVSGDRLEVTTKQIDGLILDQFSISPDNPVPPEVQNDGNLAKGKSYTTAGLYSDENGNNPYPDEYGMTLTDGFSADKNANYDDLAFAAFHIHTDEYIANGYASITVDLGEKYSLNKLTARVSTDNESNVAAGVKAASKVEFYVSDDGNSWTKAGEAAPALGDNDTAAILELSKAVAGRYVQYRFIGNSNWIMVSEVQVYGEEYVAPNPDDTSSDTSDDSSDDSSNESSDDSSDDSSKDEDEKDPDPEKPDPEQPDVAKGDINGNGEIDSMDYVLLKRAYFGTYKLSDIAIGDINDSGKIDSMDYVFLKRAYFGTYNIK